MPLPRAQVFVSNAHKPLLSEQRHRSRYESADPGSRQPQSFEIISLPFSLPTIYWYLKYLLLGAVMGNFFLQAFLLPGNAACSALGVTEPEGRMMLRMLVNILVWNAVVVIGAFVWFG